MKVERIAEVGIAVKDLEATSGKYVEIMAARPSEVVPLDRYGNRYQICHLGGVDLKLIQATRDNEVARLVEKRRGDCLYYAGLKVADLDAAIAWMKQNRIPLVDERPHCESGQRFVFVQPDPFYGVMLKLMEGEPNLKYLPESLIQKAVPAEAKVKRFYHLGVNVTDLAAASGFYQRMLGGTVSRRGEVGLYGMALVFHRLGNGDFEVMASLTEDGVLAKSLARVGPGLHHIAFLVNDIDAILAWLKRNQVRLVDETPNKVDTYREAFVHPAGFNGVMLQFYSAEHRWFEGIDAARPGGRS